MVQCFLISIFSPIIKLFAAGFGAPLSLSNSIRGDATTGGSRNCDGALSLAHSLAFHPRSLDDSMAGAGFQAPLTLQGLLD
jgi:hypothetical protein